MHIGRFITGEVVGGGPHNVTLLFLGGREVRRSAPSVWGVIRGAMLDILKVC